MRSASWTLAVVAVHVLGACGDSGCRPLIDRDALLVLRADRARETKLALSGDGQAGLTILGVGDEVRYLFGRWERSPDCDVVITYDWSETEYWVQRVRGRSSEIRPPAVQTIRPSEDARRFTTVQAVEGLDVDWEVYGDPKGTKPIPPGVFDRGVGHLPVEESR
jgi:hypothetical protein